MTVRKSTIIQFFIISTVFFLKIFRHPAALAGGLYPAHGVLHSVLMPGAASFFTRVNEGFLAGTLFSHTACAYNTALDLKMGKL